MRYVYYQAGGPTVGRLGEGPSRRSIFSAPTASRSSTDCWWKRTTRPPSALRALPDRSWRGRRWAGVGVTLGTDTVRLWFDGDTHELAAASLATRDLTHGKLAPTEMMFTYGNWTRTGDAALPWTVVTLLDDELLMWRTIRNVQTNPSGLDTLFDRDSVFPRLLLLPGTAPIHAVHA